MLQSLGLTRKNAEEKGIESSTDQSSEVKASPGICLAQGLVQSDLGPVAVQAPCCVSSAVSHPRKGQEKASDVSIGAFWRDCPKFVAQKLVGLVAISKKLMDDGSNEIVCSTCTQLVKFYALDFLEIMPQVCSPSLEALVDLWEDRNQFLKEASRVLIASMTNPRELTESGSCNKDGICSPGLSEMTEVIRVWESSDPSQSEPPTSQESLVCTHAGNGFQRGYGCPTIPFACICIDFTLTVISDSHCGRYLLRSFTYCP